MADFAKFSFAGIFSKNSDYSSPKSQPDIDDFEPTTATRYRHAELNVTTGSAVTFTTSDLTSILGILVKNLSSVAGNTYEAVYRSAANGATDNKEDIAPGGFMFTTDLSVATELTLEAAVADGEAEIWLVGT